MAHHHNCLTQRIELGLTHIPFNYDDDDDNGKYRVFCFVKSNEKHFCSEILFSHTHATQLPTESKVLPRWAPCCHCTVEQIGLRAWRADYAAAVTLVVKSKLRRQLRASYEGEEQATPRVKTALSTPGFGSHHLPKALIPRFCFNSVQFSQEL